MLYLKKPHNQIATHAEISEDINIERIYFDPSSLRLQSTLTPSCPSSAPGTTLHGLSNIIAC